MIQLPEDFETRMRKQLSDEFDSFAKAVQSEPPVSIRTNPFKHVTDIRSDLIPWCRNGRYLTERPLFTMDPLFHAGAYYVQEASSMFLEQAFQQFVESDSPTVLDLCAAPGGKSTHLASMLNGKGCLVSNEVIRSRANILVENLTKWGAPNVCVTNNDPKDFSKLTALFDVIVVDAPCSGEGMFRKDEDSVSEWSVENVKLCAERQRRIVADIFPALKEGGLLIYSTCTYNEEEDEANVRWMEKELEAEPLTIEVKSEWNITGDRYGYHFYPHKTKGEGFFLAALRKTTEEKPFKSKKEKQKGGKPKFPQAVREWILCPDAQITVADNLLSALPPDTSYLFSLLVSNLRVLQCGVPLAQQKGKDLIPETALALNAWFNREAFASDEVKVDWNQAITFLRRESLLFDSSPKGFLWLSYQGVPLGWVKNLGNRSNNLYPQEWRIRMQPIPQEDFRPIIK